ncbi:OLC1v1002812C1 [Oldenlandia corymbosa var. corymbosa]|uniref:OLC1v1002812C1 n=1 Tax=Oldenlandia corymbosa var. corymbosa TaxID=529605 RepID=A0AAV1D8L4_OLDCO|nr:OLC1v1002812C1 [Oldenlandia corymbosa var. corymbosa]
MTMLIWIAKFAALFMCLLSLREVELVTAGESDISCLKSLKNSLEDPLGMLSSWDFTNISEGFICRFPGIQCWNSQENKVSNIELSRMGLKGHFPSGLKNCASLIVLDISYNQISGPIPSDIDAILPYISFLDLSNNQLSGTIPPSIANCSFLNTLRLSVNQLSGQIPYEIGLMPRLRYFDVSYNMLTGPVPTFSFITDVSRFSNNSGLCDYPLEPCETSSESYDLSTFFRGLITGWAVSMSLVFFACLFFVPEIDVKKLFPEFTKKKSPLMNQQSLRQEADDLNDAMRIAEMEKYASRVSFAKLSEATGNFSPDRLIGIGRIGATYKATIPDGIFFAVKQLFRDEEHLYRRIASVILSLARLRHHRLVPLKAYCLNKNGFFLVYRYMKNGNLHEWLHQRRQGTEVEIMGYWPLRLKIAAGVAEGLAWLHRNRDISVVHGSICSKCILLDKHFEPKISNFWEAKFITKWDDSEEFEDDYKRDVYLFGIMLLEIITGKEPEELVSIMRDIVNRPSSSSSVLLPLPIDFELDEILADQGFEDEIVQCLELAKSCVSSNPSQRPSMVQVHATLAVFARMITYTDDL